MIFRDQQGNEIELPKFTASVASKMQTRTGATPEERWKAEYEFLKGVLPADYLAEALDGESFDDIDLAQLDVTYAGVVSAYHEPAMQAQIGMANGMIAGIDLEKLAHLADSVERMQKMSQRPRGFRAVR